MMKWVKVEDIVISDEFANSKPRQGKLNRIREHYKEYGCVDKPIVVNRKNLLLDGYKRYLVLKENNAEWAYVKVVNYLPKKGKEKEI